LVGVVAFLLSPSDLGPTSLMTFFFSFSIFCCFLCHFLIDVEHQILPDSITAYLGLIFLTSSIINHSFQYIGFGFAIGFGFPYTITYLFYKLKGQVGLGGGDIKLFAVLGIALGPIGIINNIFLSCFFGAIFSLVLMSLGKMNRQSKLAFGPFIIIVAVFQIFFPVSFATFSSIWSI
jgi:leader peptidase (prepilin peptidase)/N-methyltransferase